MVCARRLARLVPLVPLVGLVPAACASGARASCDELRAELASLPSGAGEAWEDIGELQRATERALELRAEIDQRCAAP